ncbi:MAG TPA: AIR synthase related protein, partial [Bdellovibrionales bacterium]|nr:AIR synthase related protein [Bdellovibrionales bacterium]
MSNHERKSGSALNGDVLDYKKSGVDVDRGDALVDWLKSLPADRNPNSRNLIGGIGGFAALFRLDVQKYKKPVLVSSTDGVGTKVKLATHFKKFDTVGQDLVAMCVNDLVTCGAAPLFFLDYYATGKLELEDAKPFLLSVRKACQESDCLLIGGETAEMPGV